MQNTAQPASARAATDERIPPPAPDALAAFAEFWRAEGPAVLAEVEAAHGAELVQGGPGSLPADAAETDRMQRALAGDWDALAAALRARGDAHARAGLPIAALHARTEVFERVVARRAVDRFASAPARLAALLDALLWVAGRVRGLETQAYVDHEQARVADEARAAAARAAALAASEAALADEKATLESILESMREGVVVATTSGEYVRINESAKRLTGMADAGADTWPRVPHVYLPDGRTRFPVDDLPLTHALAGRRSDDVEMVVGPPSGEQRTLSVSGRPLRDRAGAPWGGVITFRDVTTERRHAALRERARELEQQNLRISEANRLKSEFLANMSHELRTPLNAIIGFAELMHDERVGAVSETHREFLGDILTSGHHLLQLINDVLDLAKVEAGRIELRPNAASLSQLCREVGAILRTSAADRRLRVAYDLSPEVDDVLLDAGRFKQVLYNYLSNALKFTPEGGRVVVRTRPEGPGAFRLEVEDTGVGIAPEALGRLFTEFQQVDAGSTRAVGGTGLGLALTKRLVEAQGGCVGVHSVPGQGSTFHAVLPRRAAHGYGLPNRRRVDGPSAAAPTVLVIEDDPVEQEAILRTLVGAGFAVETVSTCAQALAQCAERRYDAITLDLLLPDGNGLEVLRLLGEGAGPNHHTPVIVLSVVDDGAVVGGFCVHDILAKPLDPDALLASLARAAVPVPAAGPILVIDDDPSSLRLMALALGQLGHAALTATNGEAGLALVREQVPAAVILDLLMPEMDGFEFLSRFRADVRHRRVPVIVWTIKDLDARDLDRLREGAQAVLLKGRQLGGVSGGLLDELRAFLPSPTQARTP